MKRRIVFRLDDICPRMNHVKFDRMKSILQKYDVQAIIGVVPDCKDNSLNCDEEDPLFWQKMRELQSLGWTIAMHGCYHVYTTRNNGFISYGSKSEFAGLSYQEQYEKLEYGIKKFESYGIKTDVFMAPAHSYDKNTLYALKMLGFRYITDGLTSLPYEYMGLTFIPCIDPKITSAKRLSTVCYHTNEAEEVRYEETEVILEKYRDQVISFEDAKLFPLIPYWRARLEEIARYIYKYYLVGTLWRMYSKIKKRANKEDKV